MQPLINLGKKRLCHKVRTARYYGGIATIDVVGCYLDCAYCWVPDFKRKTVGIADRISNFRYLSPEETARVLMKVAEENGLKCVRLSGGEPTLNKEHLLETVKLVTNAGYRYIFETNGLLLDKELVNSLISFQKKMYVYFSLKGDTPENFSELTCRLPKYWNRQLASLKLIIDSGFTTGINVMSDFLSRSNLINLIDTLQEINPYTPLAIDLKPTTIFPHVKNRLLERGLLQTRKKMSNKDLYQIFQENYPNLLSSGSSHMITLGLMNFYNFE